MNAFPLGELAGEMAAAAVGTAAFSVLFSVPKNITGFVLPVVPSAGWCISVFTGTDFRPQSLRSFPQPP